MVRAISLKTLQIWVLIVLLIGVVRFIALTDSPPALQQLVQNSCDVNRTALWDRQQQLTLRIVPNGYCVLTAAWSPNGESIAFTRHRSQSQNFGTTPPELMIGNIIENQAYRIHDGQAVFGMLYQFFETRIQWSPDGQWILYTVRPDANDLHLWVIRADGSVIYDYSPFIEHEPAVFAWSADSQSIYLRMVEFDAQTQIVHTTKLAIASNPEPVVTERVPFNNAVWVYPSRRGGEMLTFADDALWLVNLDTGTNQYLVDTKHWVSLGNVDVVWSADNEWVALLGMTTEQITLLQVIRRDGSEIYEYPVNTPDDRRRTWWYINDFQWPYSVRLTSPDWSGYICDLQVAGAIMRCHTGSDGWRFMARPVR